jgi:hypothetical protein
MIIEYIFVLFLILQYSNNIEFDYKYNLNIPVFTASPGLIKGLTSPVHRYETGEDNIQSFLSFSCNIVNLSLYSFQFEIYLPDIGKERVLHISKSDKNLELFPPGVQLPENFTFDVEKYWQKLSCSNKKKRNDEDNVLELEYSFPACNSKSINARNWKEYKDKLTMLQENDKKDWMLSSFCVSFYMKHTHQKYHHNLICQHFLNKPHLVHFYSVKTQIYVHVFY